jgi:proteasome accessory factor A
MRAPERVDKINGADVELGNAVVDDDRRGASGPEAAAALVREFDGVLANAGDAWRSGIALASGGYGYASSYGAGSGNPQDQSRRFLTNGACAYVDLGHLELCIPEVRSAADHVAAMRALLHLTREAKQRAEARLPAGRRIRVLLANSDRLGHSWGSHLNLLVTREAWRDLCERRLHYTVYLASYFASSICFTGQGKVGAENDQPAATFQLSQRADFFETLLGHQTTYDRPLVNTRDESHCGDAPLARLHVIFHDHTLCPFATLLKVGVLQIVGAIVESRLLRPALCLEDPLAALATWSRDPDFRSRARLVDGRRVTALEHQQEVLADARRVHDAGLLDTVPDAAHLLDCWEDTLARLRARDLDTLAGRLDWVLKYRLLDQVRERRGFEWSAPQLQHLDLLYASLDADEGLYWAAERDGAVEAVVAPERVTHFETEPPDDTRAWLRARLLRHADEVVAVDWGAVTLRVRDADGDPATLRVALDDPRRGTRREAIERRAAHAASLGSIAHNPEEGVES